MQPVNDNTITNNQGKTPSWVELYNPTPSSVSLQVSLLSFHSSSSHAAPPVLRFPRPVTAACSGPALLLAGEVGIMGLLATVAVGHNDSIIVAGAQVTFIVLGCDGQAFDWAQSVEL